jgi:hypothetical protein
VRVTSEGDRVTAFLVPPGQNRAVQGQPCVDLQRPAGPLVSLRNTAISLLRLAGITTIAKALRGNSRQPHRSLQLLGIT